MNINPYSILNISEDATYEEIKDSYLHLSRNLHPDKQPLDNYIMAKQHFQIIDKAYKSISSPLRRFVFKEFGLKGISLIDDFPLQFKHFEGDMGSIQDKKVQKKIKNMIIYMLHEDHAMNQTDKSKFNTKSIINMTKLLKKNNKFVSKRRVPQIQKNMFSYQMPLPEFYGFSNGFAVSNQVGGYQRSLTNSLDFTFSTMKRITNNFLFHAQTSINNQSTNFDANLDWIINNSTQLRFNPISVSNGDFSVPKIGIDRVFNDFSFSAITDFEHLNIDLAFNNGQNSKKSKWPLSLKLMVQKDHFMTIPKIQYDLSKDIRLILQLLIKYQNASQGQKIDYSLNYGIRFKLTEQYKLELLSALISQNYFQISLTTPKFRIGIPLLSQGNPVQLQCYKIAAFALTWIAFSGYKYFQSKSSSARKRLAFQQYNRLSQQKLSITKAVNEVSTKANQRIEKQLKYNGLIIVKAFIGDFGKINQVLNLAKIIPLKKSSDIHQVYTDFKENLQNSINARSISFGGLEDQLHQITDLFRSFVKGGQIIGKKIHEFHPLLDQESTPHVMAVYLLRGKLQFYLGKNSKIINIGGLMCNRATPLKKLKSWIIDWIW